MTETQLLEFPHVGAPAPTHCYEAVPHTVLCLPIDVLNQIIFYLTDGLIVLRASKFDRLRLGLPDFSFHVNGAIPNYRSVLALSSTCTFLRRYLGGMLFAHLSLIRENQTDAILAVPKSLQTFSIPDQFYRQLVKETLVRNFDECSRADWAKSGIKALHPLKSRYQRCFSINHFVTYLECGRDLLASGEINLFPNLNALKLLEDCSGIPSAVSIRLVHLEALSTNICNLGHQWRDILPLLKRLDLFCDLNEVSPYHMNMLVEMLGSEMDLLELNLFVDAAVAITYQHVIKFLCAIASRAPLSALSVRIARRSYVSPRGTDWPVMSNSGEVLLKALASSPLKQLTIEMSLLNYLTFPADLLRPSGGFCLVLVEQSLVTPRFANDIKHKLATLVRGLGVTHFSLKYGDPMSQSDLIALKVVIDFLDYIYLKISRPYTGISVILIEQCWSTVEDTLSRSLIRDVIVQINSGKEPKSKLHSIRPWDRAKFNSPRYRSPVICELEYNPLAISLLPGDDEEGKRTSKQFWSVEASLVELEQYSRKQKQLSSIWT